MEKTNKRVYSFMDSLKSGIVGFLIFFIIFTSIKLLSFWTGQTSSFKIEFDDILLSLIGFVLLFLVRYLEKLKVNNS